jgi:hypothetical protein
MPRILQINYKLSSSVSSFKQKLCKCQAGTPSIPA